MDIIQRIRFPHTIKDTDSYFRLNTSAFYRTQKDHSEDFPKDGVQLKNGGTISLNTYFNSFFEYYYARYTTLRSLHYILNLEGDFVISVYRESAGHSKTLVQTREFKNCSQTDPVEIVLPELSNKRNTGRIYLDILCTSQTGSFRGGYISTYQEKERDVSLGIIICTFKREDYVKKTIATILEDPFLAEQPFQIFLVDNGRTLAQEDFRDKRVHLIGNKNLGGSGGFSRGMLEALRTGGCTHFLIMDDDIDLESESICRVYSLHAYAKQDLAVSGSMLDLRVRNRLHEAGAKFKSLNITSLKHNLNIYDPNALNCLLTSEEPDYGAFWFFSFPKRVLLKTGLLMPFFIRSDDIEFGLRLTRNLRLKVVAFPGIAVWHEPFNIKLSNWDTYYVFRNEIVTTSLYHISGFLKTAHILTMGFVFELFLFNYHVVEMIGLALEAYLKGPSVLKSMAGEKLHADILTRCAENSSPSLVSMDTDFDAQHTLAKTKLSAFEKTLMLLNLNGHLIPNFFRRKAKFHHTPDSTWYEWVIYGKNYSVFRNDGRYYQNPINRTKGMRLFARYVLTLIKAAILWPSVRKKWQDAHTDLTSFAFWEKYLGIGGDLPRE